MCVRVCAAQVVGERASAGGHQKLFLRVGHILSEAAAARGVALRASLEGASWNPVAADRWAGPTVDPFEYRWRRALLQVCAAMMHFVLESGARGVLRGAKNGRDLHPIRRYRRWRGLLKGWVFPTMPTRELYVQ